MRFVIVTGMSGAGKSTALKTLEDLGYFCADNLPLGMVEKFAEFCSSLSLFGEGKEPMIALGLDVRSWLEMETAGEEDTINEELAVALEGIADKGISYEILFLDASDQVLLKRFKETRRSHPLSRDGRIDEGIRLEREKLAYLKGKADVILDTSTLLTRELRQELEKLYSGRQDYRNIYITILSFGFKYGIPADADLVFDVRFLPNPYYVEELRGKTGKDREVQDYVMQGGTGELFLQKLEDMIEFLLPNYVEEGKNQLVIAIGCTGGRHRSITIAEQLYNHLSVHEEYGLKLEHRDISRQA